MPPVSLPSIWQTMCVYWLYMGIVNILFGVSRLVFAVVHIYIYSTMRKYIIFFSIFKRNARKATTTFNVYPTENFVYAYNFYGDKKLIKRNIAGLACTEARVFCTVERAAIDQKLILWIFRGARVNFVWK